ncbi:putative exonuclease v, mitochondrial [Acrodontium crateriforme]|uniref:Exonuclease v, mitochondrial n=1 Tax=Acrodontium crateriforme TaxID=150365 RepID=A0AAQ3M285_9PEZI|nr:putative exonuclease v, mitochondrial [Acrodontium crateriforme]
MEPLKNTGHWPVWRVFLAASRKTPWMTHQLRCTTTQATAQASTRFVALKRDDVTTSEQTSRSNRDQSPGVEPEIPDTRTPIQRFRTKPKKPLSVTDIVSPAWCELQYWYNLTKYGRVKRTPAMKQGSGVHKVLEDQVHTHVPVEVITNEDGFGLRIWNIIQGLRTLRSTGLTRELEVWGLVDGEIVNGVIDAVTTECPDEEAEAFVLEQQKQDAQKNVKHKPLPSGQRTLTDFVTSAPTSLILERVDAGLLGTLQPKLRTIYVFDIKTRQSKTLPSAPSQLKPVQMQLMLYHRFFSALASDQVPASAVFRRYGVAPDEQFSDTFLAQLGMLEIHGSQNSFTDPEDDDIGPPSPLRDPMDEILAHNTLSSLWRLLVSEFASAAPFGAISPLLTAEYRTPTDGALMGRRSFAFNAQQLDQYVADEMKWWKGERPVKGVEIEEAFKCRICEFAPTCQWRIDRAEEGIKKARSKQQKRKKSEI